MELQKSVIKGKLFSLKNRFSRYLENNRFVGPIEQKAAAEIMPGGLMHINFKRQKH